MARPRAEGLKYFPHDTDATSDEKIEILRSLHGNDGYAFYFIYLERIYKTPQGELDVSDAETRQILARKVGISIESYEQVLRTALKYGCFDQQAYEQRGVLTSSGIQKRFGVVNDKREKARELYESRRSEVSAAEIPPETAQSKAKESKDKEKPKQRVEKQAAAAPRKTRFLDSVLLTPEEHQRLVDELGQAAAEDYIQRLNDWSFESLGRFREKRSHYHTIRNWHRRDKGRRGGPFPGQAPDDPGGEAGMELRMVGRRREP
jgi:hypothetical protein